MRVLLLLVALACLSGCSESPKPKVEKGSWYPMLELTAFQRQAKEISDAGVWKVSKKSRNQVLLFSDGRAITMAIRYEQDRQQWEEFDIGDKVIFVRFFEPHWYAKAPQGPEDYLLAQSP